MARTQVFTGTLPAVTEQAFGPVNLSDSLARVEIGMDVTNFSDPTMTLKIAIEIDLNDGAGFRLRAADTFVGGPPRSADNPARLFAFSIRPGVGRRARGTLTNSKAFSTTISIVTS